MNKLTDIYKLVMGLCLLSTLGLLWAKLSDVADKGIVALFAGSASAVCGFAGAYCLVKMLVLIFEKDRK
jgi:hypothetical protein